jgi:hypothetical protein
LRKDAHIDALRVANVTSRGAAETGAFIAAAFVEQLEGFPDT